MNLKQLIKEFSNIIDEKVNITEGKFRNVSTITGYSLDVRTENSPVLSVRLTIDFNENSCSFDKNIEYIDNESLESAFWPLIEEWNPQNNKEDNILIFKAIQKDLDIMNGNFVTKTY